MVFMCVSLQSDSYLSKNVFIVVSSPVIVFFSPFSPKVLSSLAQVHHGSSSSYSSPVGNGFITKEAFGAHIPTRMTPVKTRRDGGLCDSWCCRDDDCNFAADAFVHQLRLNLLAAKRICAFVCCSRQRSVQQPIWGQM